jgi:hypothetical protein
VIPKSVIPRETVTLSGGTIDVRGLTVAEMETVRKLDGAAQNVLSIAYATGNDHDEVKAWYHSEGTSAADVGRLATVIARLSGLDDDAQFPRRTGNDAVVQSAGT